MIRTSCPAVRSLAVAVAVSCSCWAGLSSTAEKNSSACLAALESIHSEDLQGHVDYLADDSLEGREAGTPGGRKAADYLRDRLQGLALPGAGVDGGYGQPFAVNYLNVLGLLA